MENLIRDLVKQYKKDFLKYWEGEKYKWQAVKWFQDNWNINAPDFGSMFDNATSKTDNLLASNQNYPKGVILEFAKEFPSETKQLFIDLYDEKVDLKIRVNNFKSKTTELVNKHNDLYPDNTWNNSYQQENAITTYLWLRYPDKYYIYKYTEYKAVFERLGCPDLIKAGGGYQNIKNGFEIYDKIAEVLSKDEEFKTILSSVLTDDCYPDKNFRSLTVDLGHYVKSYLKTHNFWAVGYSWQSAGDMSEKFFNEGVWIEGFMEDGDTRYEKSVKAISVGDYLLLKSSATKGEGHKIAFTRLMRIGRVLTKLSASSFKVDWLDYPELPKDFDSIGYRKTIEKMRFDNMLEFAKQLVGEKDVVDSKYKDIISLLKANHNLILTGAPGTGKTYMAKAIAAEMGAETEFVQFHPSYDYTDFVEGLRPTEESNGQIGFERKDGVFKVFLKRASKNLADSKKSKKELSEEKSFEDKYNEVVNKIENGEIIEFKLKTGGKKMEVVKVSDFNNIILKTPDTTSERTYTVSFARMAKLAKVFPDSKSLNSITNINDEIRNVIGGCNTSSYWAVLNEVYNQGEPIQKNDFVEVKEKPFVFIIDEINRGEISKIFGELFYSIDPGYRGTKGLVKTQYQNLVKEGDEFKEGFYVPENVYIIGTMNDIDRSVESMDFAMRRRFAWKEVTAEESMQMLNGIDNENEIKRRMTNLNMAILKTNGLGKAYQIGASYFLKIKEYNGDFQKLWAYHLEGLLNEYLRGNMNVSEQLNELKDAYDKEA